MNDAKKRNTAANSLGEYCGHAHATRMHGAADDIVPRNIANSNLASAPAITSCREFFFCFRLLFLSFILFSRCFLIFSPLFFSSFCACSAAGFLPGGAFCASGSVRSSLRAKFFDNLRQRKENGGRNQIGEFRPHACVIDTASTIAVVYVFLAIFIFFWISCFSCKEV